MANISGFKPLSNPEWIELSFDDGTSMAVQDPTGEYRDEVAKITSLMSGKPPDAPSDAMANATASVGGELAQGAGAAMQRADVPTPMPGVWEPRRTPAALPGATAVSPPAGSDAAKVGDALFRRAAGAAGRGAMQGNGMPASPEDGQPSEQGAREPEQTGLPRPTMGTVGSTSQWQTTKNEGTQTSGLAEGDRAAVTEAHEQSMSAREEAAQADFASRANQVWSEWGRLSEQAKKQIAEKAALEEQQRQFDESVQEARGRLEQISKRPPDPAQAFAGEKGLFAFMAAFGQAVANFGSALAGKGPVADPLKTLDSLIERSVNLQMAQKKADYENGRITLDQLNADREFTRYKLALVTRQMAETEAQRAQTQQAYQALGAIKQKAEADIADSAEKFAIATARQQVKTDQTSTTRGGSTQTGPIGGGAGVDQISKLLDLEKKQIELKNAKLDSMNAQRKSQIIGHEVSPDELNKIEQRVKEATPRLDKINSAQQALERQLAISGASLDRVSGKVVWPKGSLDGVGYVKVHELGGPFSGYIGEPIARGLNTKGVQLKDAIDFSRELLTTDTTGAVASPQQIPVFQQMAGGAASSEENYKSSVEGYAKYLAARRQAIYSSVGSDGLRLYESVRDEIQNEPSKGMRQVGQLPENMR